MFKLNLPVWHFAKHRFTFCASRNGALVLSSFKGQFSTMASGESSQPSKQRALNIDNLNPCVKKLEYAVRGPIVTRAKELEGELAQGVEKPFENVIRANIGDCHAVGQKPITFIRQVLSACVNPELIEKDVLPSDVTARAKEILGKITSTGCYSESLGLPLVRKHIAEFITKRDGHPCDENHVILSNGASASIKQVLELFMSPAEKSGVLIPIPQYPLYSATIDEYGMEAVGYYLKEEEDWALNIEELQRAVTEGRKTCNPRCLVVINPGNPTGQVLTYENIRNIIEFSIEEGLFLFADEVYQENIYGADSAFHSFKKVVRDMGSKGESAQLASFHSCSKCFMGECGMRGGYGEIIGISDDVRFHLNKLQTAQLGANSMGQLIIDCIVNPPKVGDPSYELFMEEKNEILSALKTRAQMVYEKLNSIDGVSCREVTGAMYAFPKITLPEKAIEEAKALGQEPDFFFCMKLLDHTGICVVPGSGFGQEEGTYHFRMTILPPTDELKGFLKKFEAFYKQFVAEYH